MQVPNPVSQLNSTAAAADAASPMPTPKVPPPGSKQRKRLPWRPKDLQVLSDNFDLLNVRRGTQAVPAAPALGAQGTRQSARERCSSGGGSSSGAAALEDSETLDLQEFVLFWASLRQLMSPARFERYGCQSAGEKNNHC